jgi:hypothetical protein
MTRFVAALHGPFSRPSLATKLAPSANPVDEPQLALGGSVGRRPGREACFVGPREINR